MALQVGVNGPSRCADAEAQVARRMGELLAQRGAVVPGGGRDPGVIREVAAGVRGAGGICVGILPGPARHRASPDLTVAIPVELGEGRNNVLVRSCDALIVIGGS